MFTAALGGWENVFIITGSLGIILAFVIFFFVKDVPRGTSEEELQNVEGQSYKFNWKALSEIFKKKACGWSTCRDSPVYSPGT
jgi:sugar phosphate permease